MLHLGGAVLCGFLLLSQAAASGHAHQAGLSIHVLNVLTGLPAKGLGVLFSHRRDKNGEWKDLRFSTTSIDGRVLPQQLTPGMCKVRFYTGPYWKQQGHTSLFPYVEVVFIVKEKERNLHLPLLLSPYSYTTYRGS